MIFEREYLNGKINGKGKEYYLGDFEGDVFIEDKYKNGKRNGKGRDNQFKGEYLNGKKWNGTVFHDVLSIKKWKWICERMYT